MARTADPNSREVRRLAAELNLPDYSALGLWEFLSQTAFNAASPSLGDALDVELSAHWDGERGRFVEAALAAGWITEDSPGHFALATYQERKPRWTDQRERRADLRKASGKSISDLRSEAGLKGAAARASKREASGRRLLPAREQMDRLPSLPPSLPPTPPTVESESLTLVAEVEQGPKRRQPADDGFESFWATYP